VSYRHAGFTCTSSVQLQCVICEGPERFVRASCDAARRQLCSHRGRPPDKHCQFQPAAIHQTSHYDTPVANLCRAINQSRRYSSKLTSTTVLVSSEETTPQCHAARRPRCACSYRSIYSAHMALSSTSTVSLLSIDGTDIPTDHYISLDPAPQKYRLTSTCNRNTVGNST